MPYYFYKISSMHARFFIEQKIGDSGEITVADEDIYHQIVRVLRRRKGDAVEMLNHSGFEYRCVIQNIGKGDLKLSIESEKLNLAEPEGGFSGSEVDMAKENNFKIISISRRVLRAETAAVAGSFLCFIR